MRTREKKSTLISVKMNELRQAKDMPRVSAVFDRRGKASNIAEGTVEVMVYIPRERTRKYISTGVRVFAGQWSQEYGVVGRRDARKLNKLVQEQVDRCRAEVVKAAEGEGALSADGMRVDRSEASFLDYIERGIAEGRYAPATLNKHRTMLRALSAFGRIRRFEDVTPENLNAFMRYVGELTVDGRPVCQATVHGYWRRLRKWVNDAIDQRFVPMDCKLGVKVERGRHKEREFLTDEEIGLLVNAVMPNNYLQKAKDLFLLQMGCGLAYQDMQTFDFTKRVKMGQFWTVQGRRKKTGSQFFVILLPWAVSVLEKWGFVVPQLSNQKYNVYLGSVMEIAGIEKHVTSHIARHTFACYCLRHGVRIEALSRALGHTDIRTTQIYARLVDNDVVEAFSKLA